MESKEDVLCDTSIVDPYATSDDDDPDFNPKHVLKKTRPLPDYFGLRHDASFGESSNKPISSKSFSQPLT